MGKTAAAEIIAQRGIRVIDTDALARQLVEPGQPALKEVVAAFGARVLDDRGQLHRGELAKAVFSQASARQKLESILHPRIRQLWTTQVSAWRAEHQKVALIVIPLLFETHAETELDATICVACSAATQQARLATRGWSSDQINQRIASQLPIAEKISRSNFVVWNEAALDVLAAQLDLVLQRYSESI